MKQLKIDNTKAVQEEFWGNGAVYHGYAGMPDDAGRVYTEEQCEIEAKRVADMKLKIARTFYGWYAWDNDKKEWNWESERMQVLYRWLKRMKDANVTVALNTGWCSPGDIDSTSWNGESPFNVEGDWEASVKNYGDWVSESLHQIVEVRGFTNVKIFVMFTEPQGPNNLLDRKWKYGVWLDAVRAAHEALVRDGRRHLIKLMGPNEGSTDTSVMVKWVAENANEYVDIYSSHNYLTGQPAPYYLEKEYGAVARVKIAGGRMFKRIALKPDTEYNVSLSVSFESKSEEESGNIAYGVFEDIGDDTIHRDGALRPGVSSQSVASIDHNELSNDFKKFSFSFKTDSKTTSGLIGWFYDIKSEGESCIVDFSLTEAGSDENLIAQNDPQFLFKGWKSMAASWFTDSYYDWYRWCKTGLQYVPKGKSYIFDEYNVIYDRDNSRPELGAEVCNATVALMNAGVNSTMLWTAFDQQWPNNHTYNADSFVDGDHRCGLMPVLTRTLVPYLAYYAFSLISRYVDGEGAKVYEGFGKDRLHTTMAVSKTGDITVVAVNGKEEADDFTISFAQPIKASFNRHTFDPAVCIPDERAEIIGTDKVIENVTDTLSDSIAAYGVTVYTTKKD